MNAVHVFVSGRVQGVYYRQTTRHEARRLGLFGWVRNLPDGRVELWAQGEQASVDQFVDWLWIGPSGAKVLSVESVVFPPDNKLQDFVVV